MATTRAWGCSKLQPWKVYTSLLCLLTPPHEPSHCVCVWPYEKCTEHTLLWPHVREHCECNWQSWQRLFTEAYHTTVTEKSIIRGFNKRGIYPYNAKVISVEAFETSKPLDKLLVADEEPPLLDIVKMQQSALHGNWREPAHFWSTGWSHGKSTSTRIEVMAEVHPPQLKS